MPRREYLHDSDAPEPNSLVVATSAVVLDGQGRVLLQRRADSGNWALPGGGMEMSESLAGSVIREVKEETGYDVEVTGLVGTYTDPGHVIAYDDGEVRREFNICYSRCTPHSGCACVIIWNIALSPISGDGRGPSAPHPRNSVAFSWSNSSRVTRLA